MSGNSTQTYSTKFDVGQLGPVIGTYQQITLWRDIKTLYNAYNMDEYMLNTFCLDSWPVGPEFQHLGESLIKHESRCIYYHPNTL